MNMPKKPLLLCAITALFFCAALNAPCEEAVFENERYSLQVSYTATAQPGDAAFVRMIFSRVKKQTGGKGATKAALFLGNASSDFYIVQPRGGKKNNPDSYIEMLAYIALSTWREASQTELTVQYSAFGDESMTFKLPFTVMQKEFIRETIALDERNTAIQTDSSPQRASQIDTLNQVLAAKKSDAVFQQGAFTPPVSATRRTSFFGDRRVYAYSTGRTSTTEHYGIDYGVPTGTPVFAAGAGRVALAENRITTGWSVVIEHLPGLYSLYYHMDSLAVKAGQMVKQGEEIGKSGATGLATGPHLHWEMRLNTTAVNPDMFLGDFSFFDEKH
jgi:murein DD-endopeptidase MepM/ murein hydrolase activator NlpD